jgi:hypothetical protein
MNEARGPIEKRGGGVFWEGKMDPVKLCAAGRC